MRLDSPGTGSFGSTVVARPGPSAGRSLRIRSYPSPQPLNGDAGFPDAATGPLPPGKTDGAPEPGADGAVMTDGVARFRREAGAKVLLVEDLVAGLPCQRSGEMSGIYRPSPVRASGISCPESASSCWYSGVSV
jgi:hypothetical protein